MSQTGRQRPTPRLRSSPGVRSRVAVLARDERWRAGDYLDAELRRAVERLKVEAAKPAAGPTEAGERLRTLWRWMNAYALAGGAVPIDFPQQYLVEMLGVRTLSGRPEDARSRP